MAGDVPDRWLTCRGRGAGARGRWSSWIVLLSGPAAGGGARRGGWPGPPRGLLSGPATYSGAHGRSVAHRCLRVRPGHVQRSGIRARMIVARAGARPPRPLRTDCGTMRPSSTACPPSSMTAVVGVMELEPTTRGSSRLSSLCRGGLLAGAVGPVPPLAGGAASASGDRCGGRRKIPNINDHSRAFRRDPGPRGRFERLEDYS